MMDEQKYEMCMYIYIYLARLLIETDKGEKYLLWKLRSLWFKQTKLCAPSGSMFESEGCVRILLLPIFPLVKKEQPHI